MHEMIFGGIIPSTQQSFKTVKKNGVDVAVRVKESKGLTDFKEAMRKELETNKPSASFPTDKQVFISIIQFYTSTKHDYSKRDVDNMAKTMLDILEKNFYKSDSQVRTLLVSKRVDLKKVPIDLGYVFVKILEDNEDIKLVNGRVKRAENLYALTKEVASEGE